MAQCNFKGQAGFRPALQTAFQTPPQDQYGGNAG